jgi:hypothetical protein
VDYVNCDKSALGMPTDLRTKTQERCLEYVTYSFIWDKTAKDFKPLYKESRSAVTAVAHRKVNLKNNPASNGKDILTIDPADRLQVIKHYETVIKIKSGDKKVENWLYVKHPAGIYGYLKADEVTFKNIEHARLLETYYEKTPLSKQDWTTESEFLSVKK